MDVNEKDPFDDLYGKYIKVLWKDIVVWHGWTDADAFGEKGYGPSSCISYGFLTSNQEDFITISATQSETSEDFNQHISIPKGCIERVKELKL